MNKTFNLYCDESTHLENDHKPKMLISYVGSPYNEVKKHNKNIQQLKLKYHFKGELKWVGVSNSMEKFYLALVDYFFNSTLFFRSVVIKKDEIDSTRAGFNYDDFYYKMYYQLLYHKIVPESNYNIFVDLKDTNGSAKIQRLKNILDNKACKIRNLQLIRSYESNLMQLADFLMGAINYLNRGENKVIAKNEIIKHIKTLSCSELTFTTSKTDDKFNLFYIDLKGC